MNSDSPSKTEPRPTRLRSLARTVWTVLTLPFVLAIGLVGGIAGLFNGLLQVILIRRRVWIGIKNGFLAGLIGTARAVLNGSSWLFERLFGRDLWDGEGLPFPNKVRDFTVIGHRGSPTVYAENTLPSMQRALKEGANALEIDLCLTKDGEVVLWHDADPDGTVALFREAGLEENQKYRPYFPTGEFRKKVVDLSLEELRLHYGYGEKDGSPVAKRRIEAKIPTFEEFMQWAAKQGSLKEVYLDLKLLGGQEHKVEAMMQRIDEVLECVPHNFHSILLTPVASIFEIILERGSNASLCIDVEITGIIPLGSKASLDFYSPVLKARNYGVSYGSVGRPTFLVLSSWAVYSAIVSHSIRQLRQEGEPVNLIAWTINDKNEMRELIANGINAILTDHPERLKSICLNARGKDAAKAPWKMVRGKKERSARK